MNNIRLNKYLAKKGIASRRKIDDLIQKGQIKINDHKALLGQKINPQKDIIKIQNRIISQKDNIQLVYYAFNKPPGVVSTLNDPHNRPCISNFINLNQRIYPVGRLDIDSQGLMLLTNDGHLTQKITHPSSHVNKEYLVLVQGQINDNKINHLRSGVKIGNYTTKPAKIVIVSHMPDNITQLKVVLSEGKNRQIRRMMKKVDLQVKKLTRIKIGKLQLDNLKMGQCKKLPSDIATKIY